MFTKKTNHHPRLARPGRRVPLRRTPSIDWGRLVRHAIFWVLVAGYGAAVGYLVLLSPLSRIERIDIEGTERLVANDVRAASMRQMEGTVAWNKVSRAQYALVRPERIADAVRGMSGIVRDVHVRKDFPQRIVVTVEEWRRVDLWCDGGGRCAVWNADGTVGRDVAADDPIIRDNPVTHLTDRTGSFPAQGHGPVDGLTPDTIDTVVATFDAIGVRVVRDTVVLMHRVGRTLDLATEEGWHLLVPIDGIRDTAAAVDALFDQGVISQDDRSRLVYIDLRVPHKAFFRFAGEADVRTLEEDADSGQTTGTENQ